MTRVDFYFNVDHKFRQLAELTSMAMDRKRRLFVYVPDEEAAEAVEHALWTHAPTTFLPHCRSDHPLAMETPIIIDWHGENLLHDDVLVNLRSECPPFFSRFKGLIEIVSCDESDRSEARARFRFYRDRGYELHSHDIAGNLI
jgi:DNA polymerase-3 subunit chi